MKNIKLLFRMSLNGLSCLSETFSNEPLDTKQFQFVMHLRQNPEKKLHLLFPIGWLRFPDRQGLSTQWQATLSHSICSFAGAGTEKARAQWGPTELLQTTSQQTARQETVRGALSVPGTVLSPSWRKKGKKRYKTQARGG